MPEGDPGETQEEFSQWLVHRALIIGVVIVGLFVVDTQVNSSLTSLDWLALAFGVISIAFALTALVWWGWETRREKKRQRPASESPEQATARLEQYRDELIEYRSRVRDAGAEAALSAFPDISREAWDQIAEWNQTARRAGPGPALPSLPPPPPPPAPVSPAPSGGGRWNTPLAVALVAGLLSLSTNYIANRKPPDCIAYSKRLQELDQQYPPAQLQAALGVFHFGKAADTCGNPVTYIRRLHAPPTTPTTTMPKKKGSRRTTTTH